MNERDVLEKAYVKSAQLKASAVPNIIKIDIDILIANHRQQQIFNICLNHKFIKENNIAKAGYSSA